MKKTTIYLIVLTTLLIGILFAGIESYALDAPHDATSAVTVACTNCHPARGATPLWMTQATTNDVTQMNNQCFQCHVPGVLGTGKYGDIQTHSEYQTRGTNGWVMECRTCHNPHYQKQAITYPGQGYILQGVVSSATISMVTVSSPALTPSSLAGEIIVPDINYPNYLYRIVDNTANTITVQTGINGGIATAYVGTNATFGIKFGKMIKDIITTPNSGNKTVKFFEESGADSFATGTTASTDSICQVCHTQTGSFTNTGLLEGTVSSGGSHPSNVAGTNCTTCHEHKYGFKGGGCDGCHGYPPLTASQGSGGLVNVNGGTGATTPGAHGKHVVSSNMTCAECHTGGMTTTIYSNNIEMGFKVGSGTYEGRTSLATGYGYAPGNAGTTIIQNGNMDCLVYCHDPSNVGNKSPAWGGSFADGTQCDDCHGGNKSAASANGGVGPMSTGKHAAHTANADANLGTFACGRCHAGTVTTGNDRLITGTKHTNQAKDVEYDALNSGATANTCNNLYCHSNGKGVSSALTITTDWRGAGTLDCKGCHGSNGTSQFGEPDYANTGAGQPNANSHTVSAHVSVATDCSKCHADTTTTGTSITGALHINKTIDVTMGADYDQDTNPANNYSAAGKTCSATTCHGGVSPAWGSNTTNDTCTKCHGAKTPTASYTLNDAAPGAGGTGISTSGATANTDPKVGAHRAHLEATHGYNTGVQCSECHNVPTAWNSAGHLYDGSSDTTKGVAELASLNTGTSALGTGGTPTYTAGQCSNVYCHDSTRFKNAYGGGTNHAPTWNTPFLSGIKADCSTCHGYPPNAPHVNNTNCSGCHPEVNSVDNISFVDPSKHVNGLVEGGGCDGCHGNPPTTNAIGGPDGVATPTTGATSPVSPGAHDKHVNALTGMDMKCEACHNGSAMMASSSSNNAIDIGFAVNGTNFPGFTGSATTGIFSGYNNLTNSYTFTTSSPGTQILPVANQSNSCSSVYCHGGGTTGKPALTGGTNQTPSWVGVSQAACGTCHGGSAFDTASNVTPTTGGHVKHAGSANLALACNNCHGSTTDMTHVNGSVAWSLNTGDIRFSSAAQYNGSASGSTGALAPSATYGNCTVYCHSIVQKTNGAALTAGDYKSPNWGSDVGNITCTSCHGAPSASGSHTKHAGAAAGDYGFSCDTCHNGDVPPASTVHVNGQINVDINTAYGTAAYNGDTTPGNGFTGSTCSTTYCHSNGTSVASGTIPANTSPVWGTAGPLACSTCHNGTATGPNYSNGFPKANSHQAHVTSAGFACVTCHSATVDAASAITSTAAHDNGQYDVSGAAISSYIFNVAGGTCAATCHNGVTPSWGSNTPAGTDTCTMCHGTETTGTATDAQKAPTSTPNPSGLFVDSSANAVGAHQAHLGPNPYRNPIACTECHKVPTMVNDTGHMDGLPATVTFLYSSLASTHEGVSAPTPTFNYGTLTCSTTYCHDASFIKNGWSAGQAGTVPQPVWSDTTMLNQTTPTATDCSKCHGYPPAGSHPNPVTDCNSCHPHVAAGSLGFSDITKHMDGIVEGGGCDGCHAFDVAGATYAAGVWSGGTWTNAVARDGIGQGWGAHAKHINHIKTRLGITTALNPSGQTFGTGDAARVCGTCHTDNSANHTTAGSTVRSINFGDGTYKVGGATGTSILFDPGAPTTNPPTYNGISGTSSTVNPKTCSNVSCHFKTTPVWSAY